MHRTHGSQNGFTLIELLLVLAIIAFLVPVIILAINPQRQLGRTRDAQRWADVNAILNAIYQYQVDTNQMPQGIPSITPREICRTGAASCQNGVDLNILTQSGTYLVEMPVDLHQNQTGTGTHYTIMSDSDNRITVASPYAEQTPTISVTR